MLVCSYSHRNKKPWAISYISIDRGHSWGSTWMYFCLQKGIVSPGESTRHLPKITGEMSGIPGLSWDGDLVFNCHEY